MRLLRERPHCPAHCAAPHAPPLQLRRHCCLSAGVVVLPVQTVPWLEGDVIIGTTNLIITSAKTDYIFVTEKAWAKCKEEYGARIQGHKRCVKAGTKAADALHSMLGSIVGLYEAKTTIRMRGDGLRKVRAQALLEYLVINHMLKWPAGEHQLMD